MATPSAQDISPWKRQQLLPFIDGLYTALGRDISQEFFFSNVPAFYLGTGAEFHVAKTGDDTTGDGSSGSPWLTIDFAVQQLSAVGQTVTIHAGTYQEVGAYQVQDTYDAVIRVNQTGTLQQPITLRAAVGDEGLVVLDQQNTKAGILIPYKDYVQTYGLRIINNSLAGIAAYDANSPQLSLSNKCKGLRFENTYIGNAIQPANGVNTACLRLFATEDLIVRNCNLIATEVNCNGYQSYSQTNTLIENNLIDVVNNGIYLKDHFIQDLVTRGTVLGAEMRYNRIKSDTYALQIGIQGTGTQEAGYSWFHHNITSGQTVGSERSVVRANMGGAAGQSTRIRVEHNTCDMTGATTASLIEADSMDNIQSYGNIACGMKSVLNLVRYPEAQYETRISLCNYNIYDFLSSVGSVDRYGVDSRAYTTLAAWQAALATDNQTLLVDNPDANSVEEVLLNLVNDPSIDDYTLKIGSAAIGFMPDGSNAGAYQTGTEVIGTLPSYSAGA